MNTYQVEYAFDYYLYGKLKHDGHGGARVEAGDEYDAKQKVLRGEHNPVPDVGYRNVRITNVRLLQGSKVKYLP